MSMMTRAVLLSSAALLTLGCASHLESGTDAQPKVKIYRTGSNVPVMVPYLGPEHLRYIEAQSNRDAVYRFVDPPIPLRSN